MNFVLGEAAFYRMCRLAFDLESCEFSRCLVFVVERRVDVGSGELASVFLYNSDHRLSFDLDASNFSNCSVLVFERRGDDVSGELWILYREKRILLNV